MVCGGVEDGDLGWIRDGEKSLQFFLALCLCLLFYSNGMQMGSHFYVDGEIGRMMTVPRLFLHSATRITFLLAATGRERIS